METETEKQIWKLAKKRVKFKNHLLIYFTVNILIWALCFIPENKYDCDYESSWPIWCTLGWGFGLFFEYRSAYGNSNNPNAVESEYNKLKNNSNN